jgi:predicted CxxxxCH...CXXCH cytochrome family protein
MPRRVSRALLLSFSAVVATSIACGELRKNEQVLTAEDTYRADVAPLLQEKCVGCHSGDKLGGSYDLSTWRGILGAGSDGLTRNVIPGDDTSLLLTTFGENADNDHRWLLSTAELAMLKRWVVDAKANYFDSSWHGSEWLYPGDRNSEFFHGGTLRAKGWDTTGCQGCHGVDLKGGKSGVSCATCHSAGIDSCSTCHGSNGSAGPPASLSWGLDPATDAGLGVHAKHTGGALFGGGFACSECHVTPSAVTDEGHLFDDAEAKTTDLRAEVVFSAWAKKGETAASYDSATQTCTVYCHGASLGGTAPTWTAAGSLTCGSCHPVPHASPNAYGGEDCSTCHQQIVALCTEGEAGCAKVGEATFLKIVAPNKHGDGDKTVGKAGLGETCWGCHGTEASAGAPSPDLNGNTDPTMVTVGLHEVHLNASQFRDPITCDTCHAVPKTLTATGHIDSDRPAEVTFSDLAAGKTRSGVDTKPTWDRETATCSNVYCHSLDGGSVTSWSWKASVQSLDCGSCHAAPPSKTISGGTHVDMPSCKSCHPAAFKDGVLDLTKHINGNVELF